MLCKLTAFTQGHLLDRQLRKKSNMVEKKKKKFHVCLVKYKFVFVCLLGIMVMEWLALSSYSKNVLASNLVADWGLFCALLACVGFLQVLCFLLQSKDMQIRSTGYS